MFGHSWPRWQPSGCDVIDRAEIKESNAQVGRTQETRCGSGIDPAAPVRIVSTESIGDDALIQQSSAQLVPEHLLSVKERVQNQADRVLAAVQERLVKEINHWQNRRLRFQDEIAAGTVPKMSLVNVDRILDDLTNRLRSRQIELTAMKEVSSATPVVLGGALVIPAGLLAKLRGEPSGSLTWSADDDARKRIERKAMEAVIEA
jgi:hypothetical protein